MRRVRRVVDGAKKEGSNDHKQGEKKGLEKGRRKEKLGRVSPDGTQSSSFKAAASVTPTYERGESGPTHTHTHTRTHTHTHTHTLLLPLCRINVQGKPGV